MNLRRLGIILALTGTAVLIVAACANEDDTGSSGDVPAEPTAEPTATTGTPDDASAGAEAGPAAFALGPCATTLAVQLPIEFEYFGSVPTGFDGINQANCTFTKPV